MKTNAVVRIILWCLTLTILLSMLAIGLMRPSFLLSGHSSLFRKSESSDPSGVVASTYKADTTAVRKLEIDWVAGNISVRSGDVDVITISESGAFDQKYTMYCRQKGDTLEIAACQGALSLSDSLKKNLKKDLTIVIPRKDALRLLEIDAASAEISVEDLEIQEVVLDTASGAARFENCSVEDLDLDTASGDLKFQGSLNNLDFDSASAKITAVLTNVPRSIDMDTASGDLELTLPKDAGFTVEMDALSSKFHSDFPCVSRNGVQICGDGYCQIQIDTMSGRVNIYQQK